MKTPVRFLFLITVFIFLVSGAMGQNMWWGVKGGLNFGTPYGKAEEGATGSPGVGPRVGFFVRAHVKNRLDLQMEILYSAKGASYGTPVSGDTLYEQELHGSIYLIPTYYKGWVDGEFDNHYIDFPIMARYQVSKRFFLMCGPQVSYLLKGSCTGLADITVGENFSHVTDEPYDESGSLNKWDYSLLFATNYELLGGLNFELGLSYGLRSIYKDGYDEVDGTYRNIYLDAMIGYRFGDPSPDPFIK